MHYLFLLLVAECVGVFSLDTGTQSVLVNGHNNYRRMVAKGQAQCRGGRTRQAANMLKMSWDSTLESKAQRWANRCKWEHSGVGENLAAGRGSWGNVKTFMDMWFKEIGNVTANDHASFHQNGPVIAHYTQMVWAKSNRLGCGIKQCNSPVKGMFLVCNYGPSGNMRGAPVYAFGTPCSQCSGGCEDGLCLGGAARSKKQQPRTNQQTWNKQPTRTNKQTKVNKVYNRNGGGCQDKNNSCPKWEKSCKTSSWMWKNCKQTCGLC